MTDWVFAISATLIYLFGIATGMALYHLLWHVDTRDMRLEIDKLNNYNRALQDEIYQLRQAQDELQRRLVLIEDANQELMRERRRHYASG